MANSKKYKTILGRAEPMTLVDFAVASLPAKVDTGAYRSAIHASNVRLSKDGKTLHFELMNGHPNFKGKLDEMTATEFRMVEIESSLGHAEKRYEVKLKVNIGDKTFKAGFTLANRGMKDFPILIGRTLLNRRFMVDTAITNVDRLALKKHQEPSEETDKA